MYCETLTLVNCRVRAPRSIRPYFACPFTQAHKTWRYVLGVGRKEEMAGRQSLG